MNTQLIPVFAGHIQNQSVQLVNARLLHSFLEVARDFSTWIKDRIEEYSFIEDIDYLLPKFGEQTKRRGGHNKIDYHITIDMAKELSMVERNEKGKIARRYFIDCERQLLRAPSQAPTITLAQIETLIEQKLQERNPDPQPISQRLPNNSLAYHLSSDRSGEIRWVMDISIAEINTQIIRQGYRLVKA